MYIIKVTIRPLWPGHVLHFGQKFSERFYEIPQNAQVLLGSSKKQIIVIDSTALH